MVHKIIYLNPAGPFHMQTGGGDHESVEPYPRSDTLSSALCYWWFRQYGSVDGFPETLPYHHSSLFPAIKTTGGYVRLYPKPSNINIDPESQSHKVFKNIKWLDESLFLSWMSGEDLSSRIPENSSSSNLKRDGQVWVASESMDIGEGALVKTDVRTRVTIDRATHATTPFHFVSAVYPEDARFWFYASLEPDQESRFLALLRLLGDEGIGADRTVGMGCFSVEGGETYEPGENASTGKWFNMGVFNPAASDVSVINWKESYYQLENRGGWVSGTGIRRQPLVCVGENAVLHAGTKPAGNLACVFRKDDPNLPEDVTRPDYSVFRDCRGYFLPCQ